MNILWVNEIIIQAARGSQSVLLMKPCPDDEYDEFSKGSPRYFFLRTRANHEGASKKVSHNFFLGHYLQYVSMQYSRQPKYTKRIAKRFPLFDVLSAAIF